MARRQRCPAGTTVLSTARFAASLLPCFCAVAAPRSGSARAIEQLGDARSDRSSSSSRRCRCSPAPGPAGSRYSLFQQRSDHRPCRRWTAGTCSLAPLPPCRWGTTASAWLEATGARAPSPDPSRSAGSRRSVRPACGRCAHRHFTRRWNGPAPSARRRRRLLRVEVRVTLAAALTTTTSGCAPGIFVLLAVGRQAEHVALDRQTGSPTSCHQRVASDSSVERRCPGLRGVKVANCSCHFAVGLRTKSVSSVGLKTGRKTVRGSLRETWHVGLRAMRFSVRSNASLSLMNCFELSPVGRVVARLLQQNGAAGGVHAAHVERSRRVASSPRRSRPAASSALRLLRRTSW